MHIQYITESLKYIKYHTCITHGLMLRCFNRPTSRVASQWRLFSTDSLEPQVPDYTVIPTNIPTVYTCTPLDPFIDFTFISNKAGELFKMPTRYVPPKDLNFKLPVDGLPEFAFVGRLQGTNAHRLSK